MTSEYPTVEAVRSDLAALAQREGLVYERVKKAAALQRLRVVENELRVSHHGDPVAVAYDVVQCALSDDGGLGMNHREIAWLLLNAGQNGRSTLDDRRRDLEMLLKVGDTTRARLEDIAFQELARVLISMKQSPCNPQWEEERVRRRQKQVRSSFDGSAANEEANRHLLTALALFRLSESHEEAVEHAKRVLEQIPSAVARFGLPDDDPAALVWRILTRVTLREYLPWALAIPSKRAILGRDLLLRYLETASGDEFVSDADGQATVRDGVIGRIRTWGDLGVPYPDAAAAHVPDPGSAVGTAVAGSFELLGRIMAALELGDGWDAI